ncbi:hypothetical protein [Niabella beijingensis]|uniref:hypothetical protein n=1 Tax=Niabella beijingensis TaxID=2872700 RepID=UPI001CBC0B57|nr:hypothetical protein [Niabella beijingensis]MBZ4191065.1 hypothetical protein [Niabella beijingensis]
MKKYSKYLVLLLLTTGILFTGALQAQTDSAAQKNRVGATNAVADSSKTQQELEESLAKAAAAAEKAAGKIRVIVENKADKLAKTSQPYIESLATSTARLIEKLAGELEKMVGDSTSQKH